MGAAAALCCILEQLLLDAGVALMPALIPRQQKEDGSKQSQPQSVGCYASLHPTHTLSSLISGMPKDWFRFTQAQKSSNASARAPRTRLGQLPLQLGSALLSPAHCREFPEALELFSHLLLNVFCFVLF